MIDYMNWLDLAWVPVAFLVLYKGQKFKGILFILCCVLVLRLQVELFHEIGFGNGLINWLKFDLLRRGMVVYGIFIAIFLVLCHFSREKDPYVFISAAISVFIVAFCASTFILVL